MHFGSEATWTHQPYAPCVAVKRFELCSISCVKQKFKHISLL